MALKSSQNRLFISAPSVGVKAFLLLILSIGLMTLDRQAGHLKQVRGALSLLVYPVQAVVDFPMSAWDWLDASLASRRSLLAENSTLKSEILRKNLELQKLATLHEENARLRALLDSSARLEADVQIAALLRSDLDPFRHRVTLDVGSNRDVGVGTAVLDASGIVGQVTSVGPLTSEVILITDPGHAIPVEVNRNGIRTIALGTGSLILLDLPFLPNSAEIASGDLLVTSGLGGRFPRGYPVAVIDEVIRDPGESFARITARPVAALDRLRDVLLVTEQAVESPAASEAGEDEPAAEDGA
ncbi:MAG: rod shape-determining protein MreC [Gammaproteobacteria bacterium]|nr:rod shape-determining protein MreC [Gammaproteobacteria bacterium]